jgi:hypothetical protein
MIFKKNYIIHSNNKKTNFDHVILTKKKLDVLFHH